MKPSPDSLQQYLSEIGKTPLLTVEDEKRLAKAIKDGDEAARELMIRSNLRLVVTIARNYEGLGLSLPDLIAEGNIGLMKAVERFDPGFGAKFSTYGAFWIKQSIQRALVTQTRTIRLPYGVAADVKKMRDAVMKLGETLGRDPTDDEVAKSLGMKIKKVAHLRTVSLQPASLEATVGDDPDGTSLGERLGDETAFQPDDALAQSDLIERLRCVLDELDYRELKIIEGRFGLDGNPPRTLDDIGSDFGLTRERIRQLQMRAVQKLRVALQKYEDPELIAIQQLMDDTRENASRNENSDSSASMLGLEAIMRP